jgi:hypothetical protein
MGALLHLNLANNNIGQLIEKSDGHENGAKTIAGVPK